MVIEKFMVGTKFYRIGKSEVPEIIRLKKQEGINLYFNMGGYTTYLTQDEFDNMKSLRELIHIKGSIFIRNIDYFDN